MPLCFGGLIIVLATPRLVVRVITHAVNSKMVLERRLAAPLSDLVVVVKLAKDSVWSCCISAKSSTLWFTPVFDKCSPNDVRAVFLMHLKVRAKLVLKVIQSFLPEAFLSHSRQSSVHSPNLLTVLTTIGKIC